MSVCMACRDAEPVGHVGRVLLLAGPRWQPRRGDLGVVPAEVVASSGGAAAGRAGRKPAGMSKSDHTWARIERLGATSLVARPEWEWATPPSDEAALLVRRLRASADRKVREAVDPERLGTAASYLEMFAAATAGRPLFVDVRIGQPALAHNAQTFELLREFIVQRGSIRVGQLGKRLHADTAGEYVGALRSALSAYAHTAVTAGDDGGRSKRVQKFDKKANPSDRDRAKRRLGFRSRYFPRVVASSFDRSSAEGDFRWSTWLATWACLMRPGEPGHGRGNKPFDPRRGICLKHVVFWSPLVNPNADGRWAMCMLIRPIKDTTGEQERRPTVISALQPGGEPSDDPCCTYSHVLRLWRRRVGEMCRQRPQCVGPAFCEQCTAAPLFAWPSTHRPWSSADGNAVVKDMAVAIGLDPGDFGGHSGRIAGGSDIRDAMGLVRGKAVVHQRGRWNADMEEIYVRETAADQMEASRLMVDARRPEMEALLPGYVQPTRQWAPGRR